MRARTALALLATTAALAGCGSSGAARPSAGQVLFAHNCSSCHSLSGRQSPQRQGGDLLGARFGRAVMLQFAREMPVRHPLSSAELTAVVDYVLSVQRRAR